MRGNELEKLIGQLPDKQSEKTLRSHMSELQRFAASEEGKRLVNRLGQSGVHAVQQAAEGLKNGDTEAVKTLVRYLQSNRDGQQLAQKIAQMLGGGQS